MHLTSKTYQNEQILTSANTVGQQTTQIIKIIKLCLRFIAFLILIVIGGREM